MVMRGWVRNGFVHKGLSVLVHSSIEKRGKGKGKDKNDMTRDSSA